jgi:hypothetical protein
MINIIYTNNSLINLKEKMILFERFCLFELNEKRLLKHNVKYLFCKLNLFRAWEKSLKLVE